MGSNIMTLREQFEKHSIPTSGASNKEEFAVNCPFCSDTKFHCQVNEKKHTYYCYRRGCSGSLSWLLKKLGIRNLKLNVPKLELSSLKALRKKLDAFEPDDNVIEQEINISDSPLITNCDTYSGKQAQKYLRSRRFSNEQIIDYELRYATTGRFAGRIIIPFFEKGKVVYLQARAFRMTPEQKILNPKNYCRNCHSVDIFVWIKNHKYFKCEKCGSVNSTQKISQGKSHWLFNYDRAFHYDTIIICEGWASAMTAGNNAVAIQGNLISDTQLQKLVDAWDNFIIMLDFGAEEQAIELGIAILRKKPEAKLKVVLLPFGDPNNYTKIQLDEFIEKTDWYNFHSYLRLKLQKLR